MPNSMYRCLLLLLVLACAGCEPGQVGGADGGAADAEAEPPPPVAAERFCPALAAVICEVNDACCGGLVASQEADEEESCEEQQLAACEATVGALVEDPRTGYDPRRAGAYLQRLETQAAGCFDTDAPQLSALLEVFAGTGEMGADCTPPSGGESDVRLSEISCAEGLTCELTLRSDRTVRGECLPADPEGCSHPHACGPDRWCDLPTDWTPGHGYGDCKPLKLDGWACSRDGECQTQHCHAITRTCAPPIEARYCVATTYPANVVAHAPIAYWRLGDADGTVVGNYTGDDALNGVYVGAPGTVDGALAMDDDRAMALDGMDDAAELAELQTRFTGRPMSMELWFQRTADSSTGPLLEFRHEEEQRGAHLWNHDTPDRAHFNVVGVGGANHVSRSPEATIEADTWYHVVGTYDGSVVQLYVDGEPVGEPHEASFQPRVEGLLRIGLRVGDDRHLTGAIDEVAVYDRALSHGQIREHYRRGTEGPLAKPFLLFAWLD